MAGWERFGEDKKYTTQADSNVNPKHVGETLRTISMEERIEERRKLKANQKRGAVQMSLDDDDGDKAPEPLKRTRTAEVPLRRTTSGGEAQMPPRRTLSLPQKKESISMDLLDDADADADQVVELVETAPDVASANGNGADTAAVASAEAQASPASTAGGGGLPPASPSPSPSPPGASDASAPPTVVDQARENGASTNSCRASARLESAAHGVEGVCESSEALVVERTESKDSGTSASGGRLARTTSTKVMNKKAVEGAVEDLDAVVELDDAASAAAARRARRKAAAAAAAAAAGLATPPPSPSPPAEVQQQVLVLE